MTTLVLLRHAKAVAKDPNGDHSRQLSERGRSAAEAVGVVLNDLDPPIGLALVSDAARTRQTADLVFASWSKPPVVRADPALYGAAPSAILALLHSIDGAFSTVLIVGHNPGIGELARQLSGAGDPGEMDRMRHRFPTASAAIIDFDRTPWSQLRPKAGTLRRFLTSGDDE